MEYRGCFTTLVAALLGFILINFGPVSGEWVGNLSAYEIASFSFADPTGNTNSKMNHFTVGENGDVYVGAVNYVFRLDSSLQPLQNDSTCITAEDRCDRDTNYNKILAVDNLERLITCGSAGVGICQLRDINDITKVLLNPSPSVAGFEELSTVSLVAPGISTNFLYVAVTYADKDYYRQIPQVTRRPLEHTNEGSILVAIGKNSIFMSPEAQSSKFQVHYVAAFSHEMFTYFVSSQMEDLSNSMFVSKISRVCQNYKDLDTFTEITINCAGTDGSLYRFVQAAHIGPAGPDLASSLALEVGEMALYAVFAKNQRDDEHSALCVYKMDDILSAFKEAIAGCILVSKDYETEYLATSRCLGTSGANVMVDYYLCAAVAFDGTQLYRNVKGMTPVPSTALLEQPGTLMSSITTSTELNHTMAFIGTSRGDLLKVHIESNITARLYERVPLDISPVLTDVNIDHATRVMHAVTEQKLVKLSVENCNQYTTCESCIGTDAEKDGDPYCGWCTLERKCSRCSDCLFPDVSTRWLSYNAVQCIEITSVLPYSSLPITETAQQMTLAMQALPVRVLETGETYSCYFGSYMTPVAGSIDMLECISPPSDEIPAIEEQSDAVTVTLSVYSSETSVRFTDTEFHFYECSKHTTCVSCVGSRWACDWCVFANRCTHESDTCTRSNEVIITGMNNPSNSTSKGPGFCPQLNRTDEVLLPNGIQRDIAIVTINLPNPSEITSYSCILDVEGNLEQRTTASRTGDVITCGMIPYNYVANEPEVNGQLTVTWTGDNNIVHILDDVQGLKVTLFKCEVEKPDCSRCVTARPELQCVWCTSSESVCQLAETCDMTKRVTLDNGVNCPDPVLFEVFPEAGPIEGNTEVTVMGTDIGRRFGDVRNVTVGGQPCDTTGLEATYKIGGSVNCMTKSQGVGLAPIRVVVTGANGTPQGSSGVVNFAYRDPKIELFQPARGPQAGGTAVTVNGSNLNIGRNIKASVGIYPCNVSGRDEVALFCTTTAGLVGYKSEILVLFDGASRKSQNVYEYTENPVIAIVSPLTSINSGGRLLTVTGENLETPQKRQIVVSIGNDLQKVEDCTGNTPTTMECRTPNLTGFSTAMGSDNVTIDFGFVMDGVSELLTWSVTNGISLEYFEDPVYNAFKEGERERGSALLEIQGERIDSAITAEEIQVRVGTAFCTVTFIDETNLRCELPTKEPDEGDFMGNDTTKGLPVVWVIHSNSAFRMGYLRYPGISPTVIAVTAASGTILACMLFVLVCFASQVYGARREAKLVQNDMRALDIALAGEVREAFVGLENDLTDLTSDLQGIGMPFVTHREYATKMLFIGQDEKELPQADYEFVNDQVERGMMKFSQLLSNRNFLFLLLQTLDAESNAKLSLKEKQSVASLLTVVMVLENKLLYLTDIMVTLMKEVIENAVDSNRTRQLFCRTESILEKLLSNWVALCLYDQLQNHTAHPLFVLYRAIKYRIESGPVDVFTSRSWFSLNYDKLLLDEIEHNPLTLVVLIDEDGEIIKEVKVLDVDSISQVKEKILDAVHGNRSYSNRPSANQVALEWRQGRGGKLVLTDTDIICPVKGSWRRLNMLKDFPIGDNALVSLVEKQDVPNAALSGTILKVQGRTSYVNVAFDDEKIKRRMSTKRRYTIAEIETLEGIRDWHLTKEEGEWVTDEEYQQRRRRGCWWLDVVTFRNKISRRRIREISFPRLLSSKGVVQKFVGNMFEAILSADTTPKTIKYMFDFFDNQAAMHDLTSSDPDITHVWKSNILPLRFWANAIKHPDYIFDIRPSRSVEASLDVIGQLFHDVHDTATNKVGREASVNKLLYIREKEKYQQSVAAFYKDMKELPSVPVQDLNKELYKASENFTGLFSKLSTLEQLWKIVRRFKQKLLDAIEENEGCKEENLDGLLEEVDNILSDDPDDTQEAVV